MQCLIPSELLWAFVFVDACGAPISVPYLLDFGFELFLFRNCLMWWYKNYIFFFFINTTIITITITIITITIITITTISAIYINK